MIQYIYFIDFYHFIVYYFKVQSLQQKKLFRLCFLIVALKNEKKNNTGVIIEQKVVS